MECAISVHCMSGTQGTRRALVQKRHLVRFVAMRGTVADSKSPKRIPVPVLLAVKPTRLTLLSQAGIGRVMHTVPFPSRSQYEANPRRI